MDATRTSLENAARKRLRNQWSNILIFGTLITLTGTGLMAGAALGVFTVGHTSLIEMHPLMKLGTVVLATLIGFCSGIGVSFYVSPFILRYAFFAAHAGHWRGIPIYVAEDADLPGGVPNVFVAGFYRGFGPFRATIFASRSVFRLLDRKATEAVFAHEISHLSLGHLQKRLQTGVATFIAASVLTSAMMIGMQWSGYANIGGTLSIFAGIIPAVLTWLTTRKLLWTQELEADAHAMKVYGVEADDLLEALAALQAAIGGRTHPLVEARMAKLQTMRTTDSASLDEDSFDRAA